MRLTGKHLGCRRDQQPTVKTILCLRVRSGRRQAGYTFIEMVIATAIIAIVYGGIIQCYIQSGKNAQWSGYSLAAQSLAMEQIEQARAATWDIYGGSAATNQLINLVNLSGRNYNSTNQTFTGYSTNLLDVPYATTNYVVATNFVTTQIINLYGDASLQIQICLIRVDTVWPFNYRGNTLYFTNTIITYLAPDNRDPSALTPQHN